ncbi:MAG TPA: rRNA maturation RNase YbeY [Limnochordales bacterium]
MNGRRTPQPAGEGQPQPAPKGPRRAAVRARVRVYNHQREVPVRPLLAGGWLARAVRQALLQEPSLQGRSVEVSVALVDDVAIADLNRRFRGKEGPTDVLSFPLLEPGEPQPDGGPQWLGEVIISVPRALEQAQRFGHSPQRELAYLAVHGCLHLLGYDHHDPVSRRRMREREEAALAACGLTR